MDDPSFYGKLGGMGGLDGVFLRLCPYLMAIGRTGVVPPAFAPRVTDFFGPKSGRRSGGDGLVHICLRSDVGPYQIYTHAPEDFQ